MIFAFAVSLASIVASSLPHADPETLPEVFASACLDGTVKLEADQASEIAISDVHSKLRRRFGKPASARIWRLDGSAPTYLYVLTYEPDPVTSPLVCGLASEALNIREATQLLQVRLGATSFSRLHMPVGDVEVLNAEDGYTAVATRSGSFTILELKQLTEKQQRRALRNLHWKGLPVPKSPKKAEGQ